MRGRQSIWVTRNLSYRLGSFIALISARLGITPNLLSLASAAVTLLTCLWAVYAGQETWLGGAVLIIGLQLGYAMDCADGPLARVTGQESSFGSLFDKICDLSSGMVFPCVLAYGAGHYYYQGIVDADYDFTLRVLLIVIILKAILNVLLWIKELLLYKADRTRDDARSHTLWWRVKKVVGLYIDEPVYRFGVALAWVFDWFWEFMIIYTAGVFVITLVYLLSSKKEMDAMDRAQ